MASDETPYVLTEHDLIGDGGYGEFPEIRAARNPDPRVLCAILERPRRNPAVIRPNPADAYDHCDGKFKTPLLVAIQEQLPNNVRVLFEHGANPNGHHLSILTDHIRSFNLRFQRFGCLMDTINSQAIPITADELEDRREYKFNYFWKASDTNPRDVNMMLWHGGDGSTALEEACKHDSTEIFEMVLSASPDISFWTQKDTPKLEMIGSTPSSLAVSNPLICAVKHRQMGHLRRLLDLNFNPNSMALSLRPRCYSPLMATLLCCDPPNWDAFSLLLAHPAIERDLLTPVTRVHILHITVALLSLEILQRVLQSGFSLSAVGATAVGHNLLHLAVIPLEFSHVNIFMESIYQSSHESRLLDHPKEPMYNSFDGFRQLDDPKGPMYIMFDGDTPRPQPTHFFDAQTKLVKYLVSESADPDTLIVAQDCHGNTALHYLAMHRTVNWELLDWLIEFSEASRNVYYDARNLWGWSAENLVRHGEVSGSEIAFYKKFWKGWRHAARTNDMGRIELMNDDD